MCFGIEALNHVLNRQATASALESSDLLVFQTKEIALDDKGIADLATSIFTDFAESSLRQTPLFRDLDADVIGKIAPLFTLESYDADTPIFCEGDESPLFNSCRYPVISVFFFMVAS